jgi:hypothetical protein
VSTNSVKRRRQKPTTAAMAAIGAKTINNMTNAEAPASKIVISEAGFGELCGLDGVEADGVAEPVGVAGDAS